MTVPSSYRRLFASEERRAERLQRIGEEGWERGTDLFDPEAFRALAETRSALRELTGAEPEHTHPAAALLFHAFHFARAGEAVETVSRQDVDALLTAVPDPAWTPAAGSSSVYLRFPDSMVAVPGEHEEAWLAGFYRLYGGGRLSVLAEVAAGTGDPSLLPLPPLPSSVVGLWARESVREGGGDFTDPDEVGGTPRIAVAAEILKLAALTLWAGERERRS